jgi:hypothetical protein
LVKHGRSADVYRVLAVCQRFGHYRADSVTEIAALKPVHLAV